jgi:hypothetical protein
MLWIAFIFAVGVIVWHLLPGRVQKKIDRFFDKILK